MSKIGARVKKKGLLFKFIAKMISIFYRSSEIIGKENIPQEPCVFAGNHSHAHSPVMCELYFPVKKLTWCDAPMFDKKEFKAYAYKVFWNGKPNFFQKLGANLLAPLVQYIFRNADALPVYRDMRVVKTYKASVETMVEGNSVVIFPECPEENNEILNQLNQYFVDVARFYKKSTGKELLFVPMYYAVTLKKLVFGKPIRFNSSDSIESQRKVICDYITDEITRMAKELPCHTVIPFNSVSKKEYKKSK